MTQEQEAYTKTYTLRELHDKTPPPEHVGQDIVMYIANANYARCALLAHMNAIAEDKCETLYKQTEQEMADKAKVFYKDYKTALDKALAVRLG